MIKRDPLVDGKISILHQTLGAPKWIDQLTKSQIEEIDGLIFFYNRIVEERHLRQTGSYFREDGND